ncbi:MAG: hypothetical protein AAF404_14290 [Pseudomonadota bacterium]
MIIILNAVGDGRISVPVVAGASRSGHLLQGYFALYRMAAC